MPILAMAQKSTGENVIENIKKVNNVCDTTQSYK